MNGACRAFNATNIIFMSARFNDQQRRFLNKAFDVPFNKILEFKPRLQIDGSEAKGMELEHEAYVHKDEDFLIRQIRDRVEMETQQRCVIIFQGTQNQKLTDSMEKLCENYDIAFEDIQTREKALEARQNHADTQRGVFMVNKKFAMGYDLKLKDEPLVIVLVNDKKMTTAQIRQMFGRSSRRQGTLFGAAYLVDSRASNINPWKMIESREASAKELGGELVNIILKSQEDIRGREFEILREDGTCENQNKEVLDIIYDNNDYIH